MLSVVAFLLNSKMKHRNYGGEKNHMKTIRIIITVSFIKVMGENEKENTGIQYSIISLFGVKCSYTKSLVMLIRHRSTFCYRKR